MTSLRCPDGPSDRRFDHSLSLSRAYSLNLYCQTDIFAYDKVLLPVHLGVHWCLAVINIKERRTEYYDSLGGSNDTCHEVWTSSRLCSVRLFIPVLRWAKYFSRRCKVPDDVGCCVHRCCCAMRRTSGRTSTRARSRSTRACGAPSRPAKSHTSTTAATVVRVSYCLPRSHMSMMMYLQACSPVCMRVS